MKDRKIIEQLDEMYCLDRDGVNVVPNIETDYRREAHIFTENGELVTATRGKLKPRAKGGETFRVGPTHSHPPLSTGDQENHALHLLEAGEPHSRGVSLKKLFKRKVTELKDRGNKRNYFSLFVKQ